MSISSGDIFDDPSNAPGVAVTPFVTTETTAAGKLIDQLKWLALNYVDKTAQSVDWLSLAAKSGQQSLVRRDYSAPIPIDVSTLGSVAIPPIPTLPPFPTLPDGLKIDIVALKAAVDASVVALQSSWMGKFLPASVNTASFDTLFKDILSGVNVATEEAKFNQLETELKSALAATTARFTSEITINIANSKTALAANVAGLQPKIDAALAVATDNTANIAWARARDQAAREAARQEAEVISDWAARGFALPSGVLTAAQQMARQATLNAASNAASDQAVKAQVMYLEVAKVAVDGWIRAAEFQLNSELTGYKAFSEVQLRGAAMEMEANRAKAKQAMDHLGLRLDFTKFAGELSVKYSLGVMNAMNGLINAYASLASNEANYLVAIANAQRAALASLVEYYKASIAQAEIGVRVKMANNENDLKFSAIAAQFIGTAVGEHVKAAAAASDLFARIAATALSGLNGVASITAQA